MEGMAESNHLRFLPKEELGLEYVRYPLHLADYHSQNVIFRHGFCFHVKVYFESHHFLSRHVMEVFANFLEEFCKK